MSPSRPPDEPSLRILLVDDDEDYFVLVRDTLEDVDGLSFALDWRSTYDAGLTALLEPGHDVCLMDFRLGRGTGLELLREARARGCAVPVVMLTAGADPVDVEAIRSGASDYLVKGNIDGRTLERSMRYAIERKRSEQALRASEERFRQLVESIAQAFWTADRAMSRVDYVSPAFQQIFGRPEAELYAAPRGFLEQVLAEDRPAVERALAEQAQGEAAAVEFRIRRRDGQLRWISSRVFPIAQEEPSQGEGGQRVAGIWEDITARKRTDEELRHTTSELRAIFQALPDSFCRLDPSGSVLHCQPGQLMQLFGAPEAMHGRAVDELLPAEAREPFMSALRHVQDEGQLKRVEFAVRSGRERAELEARLVPLPERETLVLVRDITERKRGEAMLIQATKMAAIGELAGNVAHEVNNPIGIVSAKARLLLSDPRQQLSPKVDQELRKIVEQCDRIGQLTRSLLEFSRPTPTASREPIDVREPLKKALAMVGGRSRKALIEMREEHDAGLPPVHANPNELQQVFLNLLINAADAMPEGGRITTRTRSAAAPLKGGQPALEVSVEDTGYGIEEEIVDRIFEPFFTTKGAVKGTGLGLAICAGIVRSHGGEIDVRSEPGVGTRFVVRLPIAT